MKTTAPVVTQGLNGQVPVSTSLNEEYVIRIERLMEKDLCSQASIIRKCVIRHLPELEREILGDDFVGGIKPRGNGKAKA